MTEVIDGERPKELENDLSFINAGLFPLVPKANADLFRPSFLESVFESHVVMAQVY